MKRVISVLLALIVMLLPISLGTASDAEQFSLRNNIHLGDTIEKVIELETFSLEQNSSDSDCYGGKVYKGVGTIANIENSVLSYYFNTEGQLQEMRYDLLSGINGGPYGFSKLKDAEEVYNIIHETLVKKYGDVVIQGNGEYSSIFHAEETYGFARVDKFVSNVPIYSAEWLIPSGSYYVKIELYLCDSYAVLGRMKTYRVLVGYALISNEKMESVLQQDLLETNTQMQNLNNDL